MPNFKYYSSLLILLIFLWVVTLSWFQGYLSIHINYFNVGAWLALILATLLAVQWPTTQQRLSRSSISADKLWLGLLIWILFINTGLLYETGGTINPLVHLLLLPVALGMLLLPFAYFAILALLSVAMYATVNYLYVPIMSLKVQSLQAFFAWHLHGSMLVFMLLVFFLAIFIYPLKKRLDLQRQAIENQRNQALQNEYLLSIASIASASAHQLSTPLNTLKLLEGLLASEIKTPLGKELLQTYHEQIEICSQALQGLRKRAEYAQVHNPQPMVLQDFLQTLAEEFALLHPKSELLYAKPTAKTPNLRVDESFKLALMNLLDNAARYSPNSVNLTVQTTEAGLFFEIIDQGGGVTAKQLAQLGQQPLAEAHGMGMGVFLSRMIIERFQGQLTFEQIPKPNPGLKATVFLPNHRLDNLDNTL